MLDGIEDADLVDIDGDIDFTSLNKLAFRFSDAIIQGSPEMDPQIKDAVDASGKLFLPYQTPDVYIESYNEFYNQVLEQWSWFKNDKELLFVFVQF